MNMKKILTTAFGPRQFGEPGPLSLFRHGTAITLDVEQIHEANIRLWIEQGIVAWYLDDPEQARRLEQHFGQINSVPTDLLRWPDKNEQSDLVLIDERNEHRFGFWEFRCTQLVPGAPVLCLCDRR